MKSNEPSLRAALNHEPVPLKFGTSGRRGLVADLTQLEVYLNATAELEYLQSLPKAEGGIARGEEFYFACDLRPSSSAVVNERRPRGGIAQAVCRAIADSGMSPVFLGRIPTPALASFALSRGRGSIMVTGSHIPFDRNGYKTNTSQGELLKRDEAPIQARSEQVRARLYSQPASDSLFDADGMFRAAVTLPQETAEASEAYLRRYTDYFAGRSLAGRRLLVYQHSAVGRDLLVELLRRFGAEVIPASRSETFVPIDTEAIDAAQLSAIQKLAVDAWKTFGPLDAVVSTDGDSDRPLILGVEPAAGAEAPCRVRFFGGDLVGMIVAEFLQADAVVVPISCNDAIDRGVLKDVVEPKTRIGSPFVIAGMQQARAKGRQAVCGWEANGGFLLGSPLVRAGRTLAALPTRDAFLPVLAVLLRAQAEQTSVSALFDRLPRRFSKASLLRNFPRATSLRLLAGFSPRDPAVENVSFDANTGPDFGKIRDALESFFPARSGFSRIARLNYTDGVRIYFANGDVAHLRPSGNADELRIYAVADSQSRADEIARLGVAEPDGILRRMAAAAGDARSAEVIASYKRAPRPLVIEGVVQHYGWGGHRFIPELLGRPELSAKPCAELWLGSHVGGPAMVNLDGLKIPLTQLLAEAGAELLGAGIAREFGGQLPYLFKVLDARQMLSIQAHPTLVQAAEGFERENRAGIALGAATRNYKDRNHKPEVHVALTEFWMLHGFRPLEEIAALLDTVPELTPLMPDFRGRLTRAGTAAGPRAELLRSLYERTMTLPQPQVDALLNPLISRLEQQLPTDKSGPDFWALRASREFPLPGGHRDRGIFSIYFLNLVHLRPGEATYQPAGTLHAYLEGVNVELMANSDNVLRGGLTPKHVDVPELMRILNFESGPAAVLEGRAVSPVGKVFPTPAREFQLSRLRLDAGAVGGAGGPGAQILLVMEGCVTVQSGAGTLGLKRGEALLVPHQCACQIRSGSGPAELFKAALP